MLTFPSISVEMLVSRSMKYTDQRVLALWMYHQLQLHQIDSDKR